MCLNFDNSEYPKEESHAAKQPPSEEDMTALQLRGKDGATMERVFCARKEHPQCLKYTRLEKDSDRTTVSSIVAGLFHAGGTSNNRFGEKYRFLGEILYFLKCKDSNEQFAKVTWWKDTAPDPSVGLWKVQGQRDHEFVKLTPIDLLSAVDDDGVLWILDFNLKYVSLIGTFLSCTISQFLIHILLQNRCLKDADKKLHTKNKKLISKVNHVYRSGFVTVLIFTPIVIALDKNPPTTPSVFSFYSQILTLNNLFVSIFAVCFVTYLYVRPGNLVSTHARGKMSMPSLAIVKGV